MELGALLITVIGVALVLAGAALGLKLFWFYVYCLLAESLGAKADWRDFFRF